MLACWCLGDFGKGVKIQNVMNLKSVCRNSPVLQCAGKEHKTPLQLDGNSLKREMELLSEPLSPQSNYKLFSNQSAKKGTH